MNAGAKPFTPRQPPPLPPLDYGVGNATHEGGWLQDPFMKEHMFTMLPVFAEGEVAKIYDLQRRHRHADAIALCGRCPVHYEPMADGTRRDIVSARTCFAAMHGLDQMGPRLVNSGNMHIYEDAALTNGFLWKWASRLAPPRTADMKERCPLTRALAAALHVASPTPPEMWTVARRVHIGGRTPDSLMPVDPAHVLVDPVEPLAEPGDAAAAAAAVQD